MYIESERKTERERKERERDFINILMQFERVEIKLCCFNINYNYIN